MNENIFYFIGLKICCETIVIKYLNIQMIYKYKSIKDTNKCTWDQLFGWIKQ